MMTNLEMCCEMCCVCDSPTGKAGKGDDSNYEEVGPLCAQCTGVAARLTAAEALAEAAKNVVVNARTGEVIDPLLLIELVTALNQYQETK